MRIINITLIGNPVPKGRPRMSNHGGFAHAYTPAKTRQYEEELQHAALNAMAFQELFDGPIKVQFHASMPIPKSVSKKIRQQMIDGIVKHTKKPDLDNMAKTLDALNGIVWKDDSQIVRLVCTKEYSEYPMVEIVVSESIE